MKYLPYILVITALVALGAYLFVDHQQFLGSQSLTGGVANSSTTVGTSDTLVLSPDNYDFFYGKNLGEAQISCTWTATSTLSGVTNGTGLIFDSSTSTTAVDQSHWIRDERLLAKYLHCSATATSTLSTLTGKN